MQIHWSMYHNIPQKPTSLVTFRFPQWPVFKQLLNKTSLCVRVSPSNIHRWQHHHDNRTTCTRQTSENWYELTGSSPQTLSNGFVSDWLLYVNTIRSHTRVDSLPNNFRRLSQLLFFSFSHFSHLCWCWVSWRRHRGGQLLSASHTGRYTEIPAGTDEKAHSFRM